MSGKEDQAEPKGAVTATLAQAPTYPPPFLPAVYSDGVANLFTTADGVCKFYLVRFDPDLFGQATTTNSPVAQVVMPLSGFVSTAIFFQNRLEQLVQNGTVPKTMIDFFRVDAPPKDAG